MKSPEVQKATRREIHHRNREIALVFVLFLLIFISTFVQTTYFGTDSWLFLAMLNINAVLMLVIFYLAARNVVKLFAERRRKVFGSRLRVRLLIAFVSLSLIPVLLMFLAANRVVITSVDYWFTSRVTDSVDAALEAGQNVYKTAVERLQVQADYLVAESKEKIETSQSIESETVKDFFKNSIEITGIQVIALLELENNEPDIKYAFPSMVSLPFQLILQDVDFHYRGNEESLAFMFSTIDQDYVIYITPYAGTSYFLLLAQSLGKNTVSKLQQVSNGFEEYMYLKTLKRPLKLSFSLILGLLGLIMIFSSIFMALRLSKEITAPIEALAKGTDRIAQGELDVSLEDTGKDELGQLVESFNFMTSQVRISNQNIHDINLLLEERSTLLEQRNFFIESVLENIATGVLTLNSSGFILTMNKGACKILKTDRELWVGQNPMNSFAKKEQELFVNMLNFLKENAGKQWKKEIEVKRPSLSLKLMVTALILPDVEFPEGKNVGLSSQDIIIVVLEDLTELSRIERLAAWREVAKRVAHEIKNPLTPIRLSAERLERKYNGANDSVFTSCTKLIIQEVERMQKMIKGFTQFSHEVETKYIKQDLLPLVEEILQIFQNSYTGIKWEKNFSTTSTQLFLDSDTFKQAMINIYLNATEALQNTLEPKVVTSYTVFEDRCELIVADNGIGLTSQDLEHLFEPYYSNKNSGTGLGLAIVQSILTEHNAQIIPQQNLPQGTVFRIIFPLKNE